MAGQLSLRTDALPKDWNDDVRMNYLYQNFRDKCANPEGYDKKMEFWTNFIQDLCCKSKMPIIDIASLCIALERKGCQPRCLNTVIENMYNQGLIATVSEFSKVEPEKGWIGWGFDLLVQKPMMWGFQTLQSVVNGYKTEEQFVVVSAIKDLARQILQRHQGSVNSDITDNVLFLDTLESQCKDICTGKNFELAIKQLQKEKLVHVFEDKGREVVKFCSKGQKSVKPLSEPERGILNLQNAKDAITDEIDILEKELDNCTSEIKQLLRTGSKTKAMVVLKRKKRLEAVLLKKSTSLDNIESLLYQLHNSDSEKMVLAAYKLGVDAIKATTKGDLNLDNIDTTMADIEEALDDYSEIQKTLAKPVGPDKEQLDEFEDELNELLASEEHEQISSSKQSDRVTDDDLLRRLNALRAPPEGVPPTKKPTIIKLKARS